MILHQDQSNEGLSQRVLDLLNPNLSAEGKRSLVVQALKMELIWQENRSEGQFLGITQKGRGTITGIFPALQLVKPLNWSLLIFGKAKSSDPGFKSLSQLLRKEKWMAISRGVFLYPFSLTEQMNQVISSLYTSNVFVINNPQWSYGLDRSKIVQYYQLEQINNIYSGISKEIDSLLTKIEERKALSQRDIFSISNCIERCESVLHDDSGLLSAYFQRSINSQDCLKKIFQLLHSTFSEKISEIV